MRVNRVLALAGVALVGTATGFVLGSRLGERRRIRRVADDAQRWLDSRTASS